MVNTEKQPKLRVFRCKTEHANAFVSQYHRHHPALGLSHFFSIAAADESGSVRGVAIVGRPAAIGLEDGWTAEVRRVATDGCPNACSALYGAARRIAKEMGFLLLITYILEEEPGTSLKASGWKFSYRTNGDTWNRPKRPRADIHPLGPKERWEVALNPTHKPFVPVWPKFDSDNGQTAFSFEWEGDG